MRELPADTIAALNETREALREAAALTGSAYQQASDALDEYVEAVEAYNPLVEAYNNALELAVKQIEETLSPEWDGNGPYADWLNTLESVQAKTVTLNAEYLDEPLLAEGDEVLPTSVEQFEV